MARRGTILGHVWALAAVVILEAAAFSMWNVGTRPPAALVRDVVRGFSQPAIRSRSIAAFIAGAGLIAIAQAVLAFAERGADAAIVNIILEGWTVCAALLVEMLVGPILRTR